MNARQSMKTTVIPVLRRYDLVSLLAETQTVWVQDEPSKQLCCPCNYAATLYPCLQQCTMSNTLRQLCLRAHINRVATSGETFGDTQIKRLPCVMRESKNCITGFWITAIVQCCLESDTAWNTHRFRPSALHSCRWICSLNQNQIMHRNTPNTADNEPGLRTNICILLVYLDQLFSSLYCRAFVQSPHNVAQHRTAAIVFGQSFHCWWSNFASPS